VATSRSALRCAAGVGKLSVNSAEFWLNLQSLYELRLAEKKAGKSIKAVPTLKELEPTHL
jgi:plasmid maintenance system antidote protein VapI